MLHCHYISIQLSNFKTGYLSFICSDSRHGDFFHFVSSNVFEPRRCFEWRSHVQVWVTVDGVRSNVVNW